MQEILDTLTAPDCLASLSCPFTVTVFILLTITVVYWYGMRGYQVLDTFNIPGPTPLPYLGNLREIAKYGGFHLGVAEFMKKYGKVFGLCIGRKASVVIGDPEILKQILIKDFHNFRNRYVQFRNLSPMKKGLFALKDEDWKRVRSTLTPTFTSGKMKQLVPLIEESCDTLVRRLEGIADTGKSVDILSWFSRMSLEVILSTAFGFKSNVQENPDNEFITKARAMFQTPAIFRIFMALPFNWIISRLFVLFKSNIHYFLDVAREIINTRKQHDIQGMKDFVDIMLSAKNPDGNRRLSDDEVVAQSVTFLLAGHETTSNTLSITAYYLALNPEIQELLRLEIVSAMESNPDTPMLDLANDLEYLDCVINEVLRIKSPAHSINRECAEQYTIHGITIPAGIEVIIPIYALHHDPDAWTEPEKFDPERFRGPARDSRHPFQFIPFGTGPRNCVGMRFALMEVKVALFKILSKYKFVQSPETQVPLVVVAGITLVPRDGVHLRVESL